MKQTKRKAPARRGAGVVAAIRAHHADNATIGADDAGGTEGAMAALSRNPEKLARIRLLIGRAAKVKLERELLAGGYVKKEEQNQKDQMKVQAVRAKMQEIPLRAALIANKDEAICDYFAGGDA